MNRIEELIAETRLNDLLNRRDEEEQKKCFVKILAFIGAIAAIAAIAYAVYKFVAPDYLEDFEDDFEDEFDDYFSEDEDE